MVPEIEMEILFVPEFEAGDDSIREREMQLTVAVLN